MADAITLPTGEKIPLPDLQPNVVFNVTIPLDGQVVEVVTAVRQLLAIRKWQAQAIDKQVTQIADLREMLAHGKHLLNWHCDGCGTDRVMETDALMHGAAFECGMCHARTRIAFLSDEEFHETFEGEPPNGEGDHG